MFATSNQRTPTNRGAVYFCVGLVSVLFLFIGICFFDGTIYRLINGYDDCGNICGKNNDPKIVNIPGHCTAKDNTLLPFTKIGKEFIKNNITYHHAECVKECNEKDYYEIANRCVEKDKTPSKHTATDEESIDFQVILAKSWKSVLLSVMVAGVFSFIVLVLFRHCIKQIIWGLYIGLIVVLFLLSIGFIIAYIAAANNRDSKEGAEMLLIPAGLFGIFGVISAVLLYLFRNRIKLVVEIFKEASKVLAEIFPLLFQPILTMFATIISLIFFIYFSMIIFSSGSLEEIQNERYEFELAVYDAGAKGMFSMAFNAFVLFWFANFIFGCQHFIIASTVSQWYFTRDKTKLHKPLNRAYSHLFKFHMGTICIGSLLITIVKIVLGILRGMASDSQNSSGFQRIMAACIRALLDMLEELLEFLLRNAYIIVALKGTSMVPSGKKAIALLKENLIDVIALNKFGDFVMVMARIFVAALTGILCYTLVPEINGQSIGAIPAVIAAILGFLIIHCFMTVFEMAVDTIFICFCVDCEENDGYHQQYYMSPKLMKAMQEIKSFTGGKNNFGVHEPQEEPLNPNAYPSQPYPQQPYPPQPYQQQPDAPPKYGFNV